MRTVTAASVAANGQGTERLPDSVLDALGKLAGAAKDGLMALSVGVGLGVLHELMEVEVDEVVGPKGPPRSAALGGAPRPWRGRGHARWWAGAGQPPARAHRRRRRGGSSCAPTGTSPRATSSPAVVLE